MAITGFSSSDVRLDQIGQAKISKLAPRPIQLQDTGLSEGFIADLIAKHLLSRGALSIAELSSLLALAGSIIEQILNFMRSEARIEVKPRAGQQQALSYSLTEAGRVSALDATMRSGYVGPAPVPLKHYAQVARAQTIHARSVAQSAMLAAFEDVVMERELLDKLGPSLNSGRAIFLYGGAGTGKTYISQKLSRLFFDLTLVPHAIAIDDIVVQVFDHQLHKVVTYDSGDERIMLDRGHDPRFHVCERPVAITGGELTPEMLEIRYDASTRLYEAPLQLKANNGMFIIDDMGRQRITPEALFNRWIVPLEEKRDYLDLGYGKHFSVPFDVVLIFSTNINPLELADEAFLRRIGYKIEFKPLSRDLYTRIWDDVCREYQVVCEPDVLDFVIRKLHAAQGVALLPCHPRDLVGMAVDHAVYSGEPRKITERHMQWAWDNYFVSADEYADSVDRQSYS
ncbi:MAG: AAA family ATPase [Gammaproteobacteria bacterium]|nr:AAA family ATPase [Gammaproteobacteria bacterium]MBU2675625.1 AAA family ATPase [Gammaproteobacteria bacterium]NNC56576.1 AAA family ATPase [Woeseiaceae bacterium]NNL49360.1 AAA family ATPase [Woeseiaceae bacterium]